MRIGILGGTFDPLHKGHVKLASAARRELKLSCLYIVPSKNPFKNYHDVTPIAERVKNLQRAFKGKRGFYVSLAEAKRNGPSYTIDTIRHFKRRFPQHEFFLIMGSDGLKTFKKWKKPREITREVELVVGRRPGPAQKLPKDIFGKKINYLKSAFPRLSSTELRKKHAR